VSTGDQPKKRLYSREDAAEYLGKSTRDLDRLIAAGTILAKKDGRRTRIDVAELDRYIERLPSLVPGRSA
jgi:excisionase family DNA binding protein